ncbi:hypothetical protein MHU86_9859 [Fragilaria crotonensis]|nr:hypothetical protein MHU86_9859 [Fragilaria crotonensis]
MHSFYVGFTRQSVNFGCVVTDKNNETCDIEKGRFRPLSLPPDYILIQETSKDVAQSGLKSLIFIRDFCVMVHDVTFDTSGNVKGDITFDRNDNVKGMGRNIPTSTRKFAHYLHDVYVSLFQLIDRIASSNFGSVREEAHEYKKYLRPSKGIERSLSLGGKLTMPGPRHAFPDLAKILQWQPLSKERVLLGRETDLCQMNNDDVAKRLRKTSRKPRQTKKKGKTDSGEEQSGGLGQRKQDDPSLTKSPARKGEAEAVQEQDHTSPEKIQDTEKMPDGAHTTTALSQGSEFVPLSIQHIATFISSLKKDLNMLHQKMRRRICVGKSLLFHTKSPLPFVENALKFIRDNFEKENESVSIIAKPGKKDVLCGKGHRKCIPYLDRTLDFKKMHLSAANQAEKYEVQRTIYTTLKRRDFVSSR